MKRRRKRSMSIEAEIRKAAKQIEATRMADAYKAAALGIVARKLDENQARNNEIIAILRQAGLQGSFSAGIPLGSGGVLSPARAVQPQVIEHPCAQCGQPGVRQAKRNRFTAGEPSWYCRIHQALAGQIEREDAIDSALIGAQAPVVKKPPVVMQTNAPARIVPQAETSEVEAPEDNSAGDALAEAFQALGVTQ